MLYAIYNIGIHRGRSPEIVSDAAAAVRFVSFGSGSGLLPSARQPFAVFTRVNPKNPAAALYLSVSRLPPLLGRLGPSQEPETAGVCGISG